MKRISVVVLLFIAVAKAYAQGDFEKGFLPYQSYHSTAFDSINLANGNLVLYIPLLSYAQLGTVPPIQVFITGNSVSGSVWPNAFLPRLATSRGLHLVTKKIKVPDCCQQLVTCFQDFIALDADGGSHDLGQTATTTATGSFCRNLPGPVEALDGSGIRYDPGANTLTDRLGNQWFTQTNPNNQLMVDRNGNSITFNSAATIDTIGRVFPNPPNPIPSGPGCSTLNYPGQNAGTVPLVVCYANFTVTPNGITVTTALLQKVTLPNGTSWTLDYDAAGNVASVTTPTGATVSYTYVNRAPCGSSFTSQGRTVTSRTVDLHDGNPTKVWQYGINGNVMTVTDPDKNDTVHTFTALGGSACSLYETKTQFYSGSGGANGTLLKTVDTQYSDSGHTCFESDSNRDGINTLDFGIFPLVRTTTLPSGQVSQETYQYDSSGTSIGEQTCNGNAPGWTFPVSNGSLLQKNEYHYGNGGPGPLVRQTVYQYQWQGNSNYQTANLVNIPCVVTVYGPGSVPQASGCTPPPIQANQLSQVIYGYDENNGSPQGVLGNQTSATPWLNGGVSPKWQIVYNSKGMPSQKTDPNGNPTTFAYDPTGLFLSQIQGPDTSGVHHIDKFTYDANTGQLTSHTDQNGQVTSYGYDNMRRLTSVAYPSGGGSETYQYNDTTPSPSFTFTRAITSSLNFVETGIADGLGRPVTTQTSVPPSTCSSGIVTVTTTYDNLGRKATVTNPYCTTSDPTYGVTTYHYDALDRVTTLIPPDGTAGANNVSADYSQFPTVTVTDEAGKQQRSRKDALGRLVEVDEPSPSGLASPWTTLYTYDGLGNLTCVEQHGDSATGTGCSVSPSSDASSPWRVRRFTYDSLSRLFSSSNPEANTAFTGTPPAPTRVNTTYTYDANGNLLQKTSPASNQTGLGTQTLSYCYDALNRVTGRAYSAQTCTNGQLPTGTAVVSYTYDAGTNGIGHLTSLADQVGSGSYNYDAMGRIASEQRMINGANKTMSYEYNLDSSFSKLHYPSGAIITYTPDSAGRMISAIDSGNGINYATSATYDPTGALAGFVSGKGGSFGGITNIFSLNKRLQPISISASSPTQTVFSIGYDFHLGNGDNGNVYALTNNKDHTRDQTFTYDQLNRLTSAQNAGTDCNVILPDTNSKFWGNSYSYDAWGNLLTKNVTKCGSEFLSVVAQTNNQLAGFGYDAAGNMTSAPIPGGGQATSIFDAENRMTTANFGGAITNYTYDADGNRVQKSNGTTGTLYWYMTPGVVAETDLNGNLQSEYVFFNGTRIARKDFPSNAVSYYFSDHLKTTDIVTDAQGHIQNESDYYPWGGELQFVANNSNHYKFTGKEHDNETSLDYFGARYYSNQLGRFITPDWNATPVPVPYADLADPQSLNQYTYVRDIPTTKMDPDGHCTIEGRKYGLWDCLTHFFHGWETRRERLKRIEDERRELLERLRNKNGTPLTQAQRMELMRMTQSQVDNFYKQKKIEEEQNRASAVPGPWDGPPVPVRDITGKVHTDLPDHVPDQWSEEQLEEAAGELRESIKQRNAEAAKFGEDAGHRNRIREEEWLLRQIEKKLSGS